MPNVEELYKQLLDLPQRQYSELIRQVDVERRQAIERADQACPSSAAMTIDQFARWIARQHFAIDRGITRIFHLPTGAPDGEVRLLEVNAMAHIPEDAPIEAVDFAPEIEGVHFRLFVADVTPRQFEAVRAHGLGLPHGWDFDGADEITPGD